MNDDLFSLYGEWVIIQAFLLICLIAPAIVFLFLGNILYNIVGFFNLILGIVCSVAWGNFMLIEQKGRMKKEG